MAKSAKSRPQKTVATTAARSTKSLPNRSAHVTEHDIARRAYDIFLARGCEHGHAVEDWLQAECELREAASAALGQN